ncbi:MAG TPA: hypothetical protein PKA02_01640 [Candidatus Saccharibacteria bacterium]|nr:hypothetical protein [Candidatus Saccharibacteria bacterium]
MRNDALVVKYGSEAATNDHGMDIVRVEGYAADLCTERRQSGLIVVSSGAVAVGECLWRDLHGEEELPGKQALAMLGSAEATLVWQRAFAKHGVSAGQLLLTHREIDDGKEGPVLKRAIKACLKAGIVPVVNENDPVSKKELAKLAYGGDNDGLASHIAIDMKARTLIIFTQKGGLFDNRGREQATLTSTHFDSARDMVADRESKRRKGKGTGGMTTKLDAAIDAAEAGVDTYIARAGTPVREVLEGQMGTRLIAK